MKEWLFLPLTLALILLALPGFLLVRWFLDRRPLACPCGGHDIMHDGVRLRHICLRTT